MGTSRFPGPYIEDCRQDDPIMIRVDTAKTEIGARSSGLPKNIKNASTIDHVGDAAD